MRYSLRVLSLLHAFFLGRRLRVIRDRLDRVFVHRSRAFAGEAGAGRNDPEVGRLGATIARAALDAAGVNSLLGFAAREIRLGIDGAFGREVLAFFGRIGVAHDDQLGVGIVLQTLSHVVENGFAGVIDAPRLHLVGEVAGAQ